MPLSGSAKRAYQKRYMRDYMRRQRERQRIERRQRVGAWEPVDPELSASEWSARHVALTGEGREWSAPKYQRDLLDLLGTPGKPHIVSLMKPAQVGYSVMLSASIAHAVASRGLRACLLLPTVSSARAWWRQRLLPMGAGACPPLMRLLDDLPYDRKRGMHVVHDSGASLRVGATGSPVELRGWSADVVYLDEIDGYGDLDEGDVIRLASRGVRAAPEEVRRIVAGSTPTVRGASLIDDLHDSADRTLMYSVPCPECGEPSPLAWERLSWPESGEVADRAAAAKMACSSCGSLWEWERLPEAVEAGSWTTTEGVELSDLDPMPEHLAFKLDATISTWTPWRESVAQWLEAQGRVDKLRVAVNQVLGQPFESEDANVDPDRLDDVRDDLSGDLPAETAYIVAALDVQEAWLAVGMFAFCSDGRILYLHRADVDGDTDHAKPGSAWREARQLVASYRRRTADGRTLNCRRLVADTGFRPDVVTRALGRRAVAYVKGTGGWTAPLIGRRSRVEPAGGLPYTLSSVGVDGGKLAVVRAINEGKFRVDAGIRREWVEELAAERLETVRVAGRRRRRWVESHAGARNESLDLAVYALASTVRMPPIAPVNAPERPQEPISEKEQVASRPDVRRAKRAIDRALRGY